jgi:ABC-type glycerol-3-phosphate transport system permease component
MAKNLWNSIKRVLLFLSVVLIGLVFLFPLIWIVLSSLKTRVQNFALPPLVVFEPTFDNYVSLLQTHNPAFAADYRNSFIIAITSTLISLVLGSMAAYGFSRYTIKGGSLALGWILSLRFFPVVAMVIPIYVLFRAIGLLDTHIALILVYCIFNISFAVWFLKGFFDEIPASLEEAGRLDGYSPLQVFLRISLPLVRPGIITTSIFCLIQSVNEFLIALSLTARVAETTPVALAKLQTAVGPDWGKMSAAATLLMLPVLVFTILVRNQLIRGMSFGRLK